MAEDKGAAVVTEAEVRPAHWVPYGTSMIERAGIAFVDSTEGEDVVRHRQDLPTTGQVVSIKSEESGGSGPIRVDGMPLFEVRFEGSRAWSCGWGSRLVAAKLAQSLGARLEEA